VQDLNAFETIRNTAKKIGAGIGQLLGKVNPDVWRELGYVSMSSYSLLLPRQEEVFDRGVDGFLPVVLVHGLGANRGAWWPLRLFLRMNGHRRIYAFNHDQGSIEEHAEDLKDFVDAVLQATGEDRVDLVAHSIGGLISRYAVQRLGLDQKVRTLVTLATPHQGTYAAQYANTTLVRSLRPESGLVSDLNKDGLAPYPVQFIAVYSDRDIYVVPAGLMTHPDAENIFIPDLSHSQYLVSPPVFRFVASCLKPYCRSRLLTEHNDQEFADAGAREC